MMQAVVYRENGLFTLEQRPVPEMQEAGDAIVRVTLSSICSSDLHIKHGSVPRAKPGVIVGHEMVGVVEQVGETCLLYTSFFSSKTDEMAFNRKRNVSFQFILCKVFH